MAKQSATGCFMARYCRSLPLMPSLLRIALTNPQAVFACLPMSLSFIASEQLMYLSFRIFTFSRYRIEKDFLFPGMFSF
jgi:hypothetical protein